jgi:hypothetical protein
LRAHVFLTTGALALSVRDASPVPHRVNRPPTTCVIPEGALMSDHGWTRPRRMA